MNAPLHAEKRLELRAQCNAAIGILEAAACLVATPTREGLSGAIGQDVADINRRIHRLQQKLLKLHDGATP